MDKTIQNINKTKEIVGRRYSISDDLYGTMFLVCYGLITKFGEFYTPIIDKLIRTTDVYVGDKPITTLLDEGGYGAEDIYCGEDLDNKYFSTSAASFPGDDIWFEDGKIRYYRNNPTLFCSTTDKEYTEVLNSILHEFAHLVKGSINYLNIDNSDYFSIRSGLNIFGGELDKNGDFREFSENLIFDEVINVFQTTDMMMEIGKLIPTLLPLVVQKDFSRLNLDDMNALYGYEYGVEPMLSLWHNEHFKSLVEDNIVVGNLCKIRDEFNYVVGRNYFNTLSRYLNLLEYAEDEKEQQRLTSFVRTIVRIYNLKTKGLEKRKH